MAKNIRKATNTSQEIRRLGVLMERSDDRWKLVAEQYGDISKKLDIHTNMMSAMAEDIEIMKQNIEFLKSGFKKKVDVDEFSALERRVALLERRR